MGKELEARGLDVAFYLILSILWKVPSELWVSIGLALAQQTKNKCSLDFCISFSAYIKVP